MLSLNRFFSNPFADKEISNAELQAFSEDHLGKLLAANAGDQYNEMISATLAAFTGYFGELTKVSLKAAVQKAATQTMGVKWAEFVKYMTTRGEARVTDRAGKSSAVYMEFFPQGLTEYHGVKIADGQTLARRVKASAFANEEVLGTDFLTKVNELADAYLNAREVQVGKKGAVTDSRGSRNEAKAALQDRLFDNLLALAGEFKDPAKCALFFDQSLLENPEEADEPSKPQ